MKTVGRQLDPHRKNKAVEDFERSLRSKVIGQSEAVDAMVSVYQTFKAGMSPANRPIGNLLFLGPTGTGKTRVVEAAAEVLFGSENACIKVDCTEFIHSHEISKLTGSPPGYLGHRETKPRLSKKNIEKYHTEDCKLTFILFDEIEKANEALWQLLLNILEDGVITLGNNEKVEMANCILVMTSNVGASEMSSLINGGMGFKSKSSVSKTSDTELDGKIKVTVMEAVKRKFSPEFLGRIDSQIVFKTLNQDQMIKVTDLELAAVQDRILSLVNCPNRFTFACSDEVKSYLLKEGTNAIYGARPLKKLIEKVLVAPLANILSTDQLNFGDFIQVSLHEDKLVFTVEGENSLTPLIIKKFDDIAKLKTAKALEAEKAAEDENEEGVEDYVEDEDMLEAEDEEAFAIISNLFHAKKRLNELERMEKKLADLIAKNKENDKNDDEE